ncbi:MAG: hypothetical protein IPK03_15325 [Bacteroidetes bacterium]|nr:hypothetical protein [Bacteroidota bacterium]
MLLPVFNYNQTKKPPIDTWIKLTVPNEGKVVYNKVALFNNIPLSNFKNINGDAKFVNRHGGYLFGYKINFDIALLDSIGIKEVTYGISFKFTLIDKDGFEIREIESLIVPVESGKKYESQDIIPEYFTLKTIELTKSINLVLYIHECRSCKTY